MTTNSFSKHFYVSDNPTTEVWIVMRNLGDKITGVRPSNTGGTVGMAVKCEWNGPGGAANTVIKMLQGHEVNKQLCCTVSPSPHFSFLLGASR